jgi:hypothetical protein
LTKFIVAEVDFPAVSVSGNQLFSINAPSNPSLQNCPIQPLAQPCTWLNHADVVPLQYTGSIVRETLIIDPSHGGGRPQFVFHSNDDGSNVQQWSDFSASSDGTTCTATKTTECVAANFVDSSGRSIVVVQLAPGDGNVFGLPW